MIAHLKPGHVEVGGNDCMIDAKGRYVPTELVKQSDQLQDDVARDLFARAVELSAKLAAFKAAAFSEVDAFLALLDEKYGAKIGGVKGNLTLASFDGLIRVIVSVADQFSYGPELQTAKQLVEECVIEWSVGSRPEIIALVNRAFQPDQEGNVSRSALLSLKSLDIKDERWIRAMEAIRDAETVENTKRYIRFAHRPNRDAKFAGVLMDLATV